MSLSPALVRIALVFLFSFAIPLRAQNAGTPSKTTSGPPPAARAPSAAEASAKFPELKLVSQFDADGDNKLDDRERRTALAYLESHPPIETPTQTGRRTPPPPPVAALEPVKRGATVTPDLVESLSNEELLGTRKIRTFFLTFAEADWETQLAGFARTDVQVPAQVVVDGKSLVGVGVHFRPPLSGETFTTGYKRTLLLALDYTAAGQELLGHRRLELQAAPSDPTLLRTLLYHRIRQEYLPGPSGSLVRVVINGEDWGIYTCMEPFDTTFVRQKLGPKVTMAWTARPGANLAYLGDDPNDYRSRYHLESPEDPAAWAKLIHLCKTLNQPVDDNTGHALAGIIDPDSVIRFLALQNAFINQDGYGSETGRYGLYVGDDGLFRLVPLDAERSFRLIQVTEYAQPTQRRGPLLGSRGKKRATPAGNGPSAADREAALLKPYLNPDFPKQSSTDLARLLSYSLISKSDYDHDDKVSAEEWHDFARSWFVIMDEDVTGSLTRDQFIAKIRVLVAPPSALDGRTVQTFGADDPSAMIGADFLKVIETNHDGRISRDEMVAGLDELFLKWAGSKSGVLTQPKLQQGLSTFFSKSVFLADQTFIPNTNYKSGAEVNAPKGGHGGRDGGRGAKGTPEGNGASSGGNTAPAEGAGTPSGGSGSGFNTGPVHLGTPMSSSARLDYSAPSITTFGEQLDPFEGRYDETKPLMAKVLAIPGWRTRYQNYLSQITEDWLLWSKLGPIAKAYHESIAAVVRQETHRPFSYERFVQELDQNATQGSTEYDDNPSLKSFVTARRSYLQKNNFGADGD